MSIDRNTARIVVPPILALGLVAVLVNPLAAASPTDRVMATTGGAADATAPAYVPTARSSAPSPAGMVVVGIPAVAFTTRVAVSHGHLRTPVLLADDTVTGQARVVGASTGPGCTATLTQGVPAWLDCSISVARGATPRVLVTLSDGRTETRRIALG